MAKQNGKNGKVVDDLADGKAVGETKAEKDDDSVKTPLKPRTQKTLKIIDTKKENNDEDLKPSLVKGSRLNDEEDGARRQYEESVAKMRLASERIKRIKAEKEERFKMKLEEQKKMMTP